MLTQDLLLPPHFDLDHAWTVPQLVQASAQRWWACSTDLPDLGLNYTPAEQAEHEKRLAGLVDQILDLLDHAPQSVEAQHARRQALSAQALPALAAALHIEARELDAFEPEALGDLAVTFAQKARRFDPALSGPDIYQAGRNVVTAGVIQALLGLPVQLTPAVFAYSLLYPYSDNVLDAPDRPAAAKQAFNARFRRRLMGESGPTHDPLEAKIDELVGRMERQYARAHYPQVWDSLLAIHAAQVNSLQLLAGGAAPYEVDVLGLTLEKGGTSVLADGYLVAGSLTPAEAGFLFGLGAFLQIADDLEDVTDDLKDGRLSVFTLAARHWPLDALTNRALNFGNEVLDGAAHLPRPASQGRQDFLRRAAAQPLIHAAWVASRYYTPGYQRSLQARSPVRGAFVHKQRQRLSRHRASWMGLLTQIAG